MTLDELDRLLNDPVGYSQRRRPAASMPQEDYDSLLNNLTGAPMSALGWIGNTLDKPGRAVRGLLGGRPEELANLIPFSDTLGITDSEGLLGGTALQVSDKENALSGRDLLREHGLVGEEDNWGNFLGGLGVEIATDPLTYLTLGTGAAATQGGKLATKAGLMPARAVGKATGTAAEQMGRLTTKFGELAPSLGRYADDAAKAATGNPWTSTVGTVDDIARRAGDDAAMKLLTAARGSGKTIGDLLGMADEPLSALASYGIGDYQKMFGLGEAGVPVGKVLDATSDIWRESLPGRTVSKLFGDVRGRDTVVGQAVARSANTLEGEMVPKARGLGGKVIDEAIATGLPKDVIDAVERDAAEGVWPDSKHIPREQKEALAAAEGKSLTQYAMEQSLKAKSLADGKDYTPFAVKLQPLADAIEVQRLELEKQRQINGEMGLADAMWDSKHGVRYAKREYVPTGKEAGNVTNKALPVYGSQDMHRLEMFDVAEGTGMLQRLASKPVEVPDLSAPMAARRAPGESIPPTMKTVTQAEWIKSQLKESNLKEPPTQEQAEALMASFKNAMPGAQEADANAFASSFTTQWQAQDALAQMNAGRLPADIQRVRLPPSRAPRVPKKVTDLVMKQIDPSPNNDAVERMAQLQKENREGPALAEFLKASQPPTGPIPQFIYDAFYDNSFIASEVDDWFKGGWDELAEQMESELRPETLTAVREQLGVTPGIIDEAKLEELRALKELFKQAKSLARWIGTNDGKWNTDTTGLMTTGHISEVRKASSLQGIAREIHRAVEPLMSDPSQSQQLLDALKAAPPAPAGPMQTAPQHPLARAVGAMLQYKKPVPAGKTRLIDAVADLGLPNDMDSRAKQILTIVNGLPDAMMDPSVKAAIAAGDANGLIALDNLVVPTAVANDLKGFAGGMNLEKNIGPFVAMWDQLTNLLKNHLTVPFPQFSLRNLLSLAWQDGVVDNGFAAPAKMFRNWKRMNSILVGEEAAGVSKLPIFAGRNLTDAQATRELSVMLFGHGIGSRQALEASDTVGKVGSEALGELPRNSFPGGIMSGAPFSGYRGGSWKPWEVRGGPVQTPGYGDALNKILPASNEASKFKLSKGGEHLNSYFESLGRGATVLRLMEEGYDIAEAVAKSNAAHVDFSKLAPFERDVMKRISPFYTYTRNAVPWNLRELAERPGGIVAQGIRTTTQDDDGYIPEQAVGSIPFGNEVNGNRRFLNLDLPFNVLNDVAGAGRGITGTVSQTGYRGLSMLHPAIKAPLEVVTGQSFFQRGRPLQDLYSRTGANEPLVDQAVMNSPLSRYVGTAGMLADPRKSILDKAVNLGTGVRVSDIDVEKSRERAAAKAAMDLLREGGAKTFERVYFPEGMDPTPEESQLMQLLQTQAQRRRAGR